MTCIGIDLGTTKVVVAVVQRDGVVTIVPDENDTKYLINPHDDDVGFVAEHPCTAPVKVIADDAGRAGVQVECKGESMSFSPAEICCIAAYQAKAYIGSPITDAVIAVPPHHTDEQRRATMEAGALAGLNVMQLVSDTSAAALACCGDKRDAAERNILVYDHGKRSCEISVIKKSQGRFNVLSSRRVYYIGGEWFVHKLRYRLIDEFEKKSKKKVYDEPSVLVRLEKACEEAKLTLSTCSQASIKLDDLYEGIDFHTTVTRDCFESVNDDIFNASINEVRSLLKDVGMDVSSISDVILTGGSSRIPKIQQLLLDIFGSNDVKVNINHDDAIVLGAAMQAAILTGNASEAFKEVSIAEVANLTIEVESSGDKTMPIIAINDVIPSSKTIVLTAEDDNQSEIDFKVRERNGRRRKLLGEFTLSGGALAPKGVRQIEIKFDIDHNGILHVSATDKSTGENVQIVRKDERHAVDSSQQQNLWELMHSSTKGTYKNGYSSIVIITSAPRLLNRPVGMEIVKYLLLLLPTLVHGQTNCNQAPSEAMRTVCLQLKDWDDDARSLPTPGSNAGPPGGGPEVSSFIPDIITDPIACNEIQCICRLVGGKLTGESCRLPSGAVYSKGVRKEYRMLSDAERSRFHAAMWTLKRNGEYDRFAHIHANVNQAPSAHSGPSFLPWHREYVKRFEIALRLIDPTLALPYWDTTLDGALTNAQYSSLWSDELMGSVMSGAVTRGAFKGWTSLSGGTILRHLGRNSTRVLTANDRGLALGKNRIEGMLAFINPRNGCPYPIEWDNIEFAHGYSHVWVGGEMFAQHTAAFDPLFFMYHSFIDLLWEDWRQQRQNREARRTAYPPDNAQCSSTAHFGRSVMSPFAPLQNIDGLSNDYTDNLYSFDTRRPSCSLGDNCGSKFLFCDRSHGAARCSSKIRVGQPCTGYTNGETMCYDSVCERGVCVTATTTPTTLPPITTPPTPTVPPQVSETCFNEHECCAPWQARGECARNPGYMRVFCQASCNICSPRLYSLATECSDRHRSCRAWAGSGECARNAQWMAENCRWSCNRCGRTRQQTCS